MILTEWNKLRAMDLERLSSAMVDPRMADIRNVYDRLDVLASGFKAYNAVGR